MSKPTKIQETRAAYVRHGYPIPLDAPDRPARYYVRYVRDNGVIVTRPFVTDHAARKFAERLRAYGKRDVAVFENHARPRWSRIG